MLIGLKLGNSFGTWGGYLVGVSLVTLRGLTIGTGEGYLVGLSLGLTIGPLLESTNPVSMLYLTLLGEPIGLWFGYGAVIYRCSCCRLADCHEATFQG